MLRTRIYLIACFVLVSAGSTFGQEHSLANQIMDADEARFVVIFPKLKERAEQELPALIAEIEKHLPPDATEDAREELAKRQANACVALLKLKRAEKVWPVLKHSPDPRTRSYLIHRIGPFGVDPQVIVDRIGVEPDISVRRALLLSLGEFNEKSLPTEDRARIIPLLQKIYRTDNDPGLHAAAEWLLRRWDVDEWLKQTNDDWASKDAEREKPLDSNKDRSPQWYVTSLGQTMVVIPGPVEFKMGQVVKNTKTASARQHKRRIGRTFALSAKLVTMEEYRNLADDPSLPAINDRNADLPVAKRSWYDAAQYCNWLSEEEGIPEDQWCFETIDDALQIKKNYVNLTGYRLPTLAEMEYATKAGATTARFFGETDGLLPKYAWYVQNSQGRAQPVGRLKPNDLGLFDVHGNVYTWCQGWLNTIPNNQTDEPIEDQGDDPFPTGKDRGLGRGGSYETDARDMHCVITLASQRTSRENYVGFRLARTILTKPIAESNDGKIKNTDK